MNKFLGILSTTFLFIPLASFARPIKSVEDYLFAFGEGTGGTLCELFDYGYITEKTARGVRDNFLGELRYNQYKYRIARDGFNEGLTLSPKCRRLRTN